MLIPVMLLQSNMTLMTCVSFYYNRQYIEKNLCIQRDMENNTCQGQCVLMQKLKEQQEQERQHVNVHIQEALVDMSTDMASLLQPPVAFALTARTGYQSNLFVEPVASDIDRPPILV